MTERVRKAERIERVSKVYPVHRTYRLNASNSEEHLYPGQKQTNSFFLLLSKTADGRQEEEPALKSGSYDRDGKETFICGPEKVDVKC